MKLFQRQFNIDSIPKWMPIILFIFALLGFIDATYLTIEHFLNSIPPCTIGGCETVLTSVYAEILGIPVALLGSLYYLIISVFIFIYFDTKKEIFLRIPSYLSVLGLLSALWFSHLQIFIIKAFCPYCAVSAFISIMIFSNYLYIYLCYNTKE